MGRAAELIGATPAFLRSIGEAGLITPERSEGGHRRYSRSHLRVAQRARELVDQGTAIDAACRIISLEDQLEGALRLNDELRRSADPAGASGATEASGSAAAAGAPETADTKNLH